MSEFSDKERKRFRRLLEVAHSTTFEGEREAAMGAATRLAEAHGMSLREAAGMAETAEERGVHHRRPPPKPKAEPWADTAGAERFHRAFHARQKPNGAPQQASAHRRFQTDLDHIAADKKRFDEAMADAIRRGLDAEERRRAARLAAIEHAARRRSSRRWRPRAEFIRVLLKETCMSVREIAATVGVPVHDVVREKLLLRAPV